MRKGQRSEHSFYCLKCGKAGIPISRPESFKRERMHRKKLYCPWCKMIVNHIECRCEEDVYNFKRDFEDGVYEEELRESLDFIQKEEAICVKYYT